LLDFQTKFAQAHIFFIQLFVAVLEFFILYNRYNRCAQMDMSEYAQIDMRE